MNPDKLINDLEALVTFRNDGDDYAKKAYPILDEILKLKPESLTRKQQDRLQVALDRLDNAMQDDLSTEQESKLQS